MADQNGDKGRLDLLEKAVLALIQSNETAHKRLDAHDRAFERFERMMLETGERTERLLSSLRDLIDRIPPQNLLT